MGGSPDTVTNKTEPPDWAVPYFKDYLSQSQQVADIPYTPYAGSTNAGFNDVQYAGLDATANRALYGSPEQSAGRNELTNTLGGGYLSVPAAQNGYMGAQNANAGYMNPYASVQNRQAGVTNQAATLANPFASQDNPYLQSSIDNALGDVTRNYNLNVTPGLLAANSNSGSFGNSGLAQREAEMQRNTQQEMGRMANDFRFQDYAQRAALNENAVNRQFQAGESLAGRQFSAGENVAARQFGAGQQQAQNIYGSGENYANRLFQGGESAANRSQAAYEQERQRMMSGLGYLDQFQNMDYRDTNALLGVGDALQRNEQAGLNDEYRRWLEAQNYPRQQLGVMGGALGGANYGQSATGQNLPGTSPAAGALGGAVAGASAGAGAGPYGAVIGGVLGGLTGYFGS